MNHKSIINSALYVCGNDGISISDLKKITDLTADQIRKLIKQMNCEYENNPDSGLFIKHFGDNFYLLTKPQNQLALAKLATIKSKSPLSPSILETLAIIVYNRPCTKTKIEAIRKVDATGAIDKLLSLGLITKVGESQSPGHPHLFDVTQKFYNLFGIKNLSELPKIDFSSLDNLQGKDINFFNSNRDDDNE